jgi:hypothetical protein
LLSRSSCTKATQRTYLFSPIFLLLQKKKCYKIQKNFFTKSNIKICFLNNDVNIIIIIIILSPTYT